MKLSNLETLVPLTDQEANAVSGGIDKSPPRTKLPAPSRAEGSSCIRFNEFGQCITTVSAGGTSLGLTPASGLPIRRGSPPKK